MSQLALKIVPYLDLHLVFPVLEFLEQNEIYPKASVQKTIYELSKKTKMIDYQKKKQPTTTLETSTTNNNTTTSEEQYESQKKEIFKQIEQMKQTCSPLLTKLKEYNENKDNSSNQNKQEIKNYIFQDNVITLEMLDKCYDYSKILYDSGDYELSAALLTDVKQLYIELNLIDKAYQSVWGKLASEIMCKEWDASANALNELKELMENKFSSMLTHERNLKLGSSSGANGSLHQGLGLGNQVSGGVSSGVTTIKAVELELINARCWFLHWSLFIAFFYAQNGYNSFLELFFGNLSAGGMTSAQNYDLSSNRYISALFQSNCTYLLRYLAIIIILKKRNKNYLNSLVKFLEQHVVVDTKDDNTLLSDPVIQFIYQLYVNFDFKKAHDVLLTCENVLKNDYFTNSHTKDFMNQAKNMLFDSYCKVSHAFPKENPMFPIDEDMLNNALNSSKIAQQQLNEKSIMAVKKNLPNAYLQVLEKTDAIMNKTNTLKQSIDKMVEQKKGQ
ncbi:hypothetical protein ABK040_007072 [Willaertia magna]